MFRIKQWIIRYAKSAAIFCAVVIALFVICFIGNRNQQRFVQVNVTDRDSEGEENDNNNGNNPNQGKNLKKNN